MSKIVVLVLSVAATFFVVGERSPGGEEFVHTYHASKALSLCTTGEEVVFNCSLRKSMKLVSLCASAKLSKTEGYLQYRFGMPDRIELEYPRERVNSQKAFEYSHYFRAKVDLTEISFTRDGYAYKLFDEYNGEETPTVSGQGISVTSPEARKETTYRCSNKAQVDFSLIGEVLENTSAQ